MEASLVPNEEKGTSLLKKGPFALENKEDAKKKRPLGKKKDSENEKNKKLIRTALTEVGLVDLTYDTESRYIAWN